MQTRKEQVRGKIVSAARDEFLDFGYANSSMRNIASKSDITVGNIYSYFSKKDDLFESILKGTVEELLGLLNMEFDDSDEVIAQESIKYMAHSVADVFYRNRTNFIILMDKSAGSKYENIKSQLISRACERIISDMENKGNKKKVDPLIAESLSVSLIKGLIHLFKHTGKDKRKLEKLVEEFLTVVLKGFYQ